MEEKAITVFTPTYNRAHLLGGVYESLKRQDCKDFLWLIIDDGSTDNTKETVEEWQKNDNGFGIRYVYKENGGLHTGYNAAIANMTSELSICIDSDDMLADGAIRRILEVWAKPRKDDVAGIIGLDFSTKGERIGVLLPETESINAASLLCVKHCGDKKYVMRNDLLRTVAPMPTFEGEKNFNPHYMIIKLSKTYRFIPLNECLCVVDYQPTGMSANIFNQYVNSPRSFAEQRRAVMELKTGLNAFYRYKTAAHYVSSCIIAREKHFISKSPKKLLTLSAILPGCLITLYIRKKTGGKK